MKETIETESGPVTVATITVTAAKAAQLRQKTGEAFNDAFTVEAVRAGGHEDPQALIDGLGFLTDYPKVHHAAMRVNGLKAPTKGEEEPAAPATESTSTTSTAASPAGTGTE